MSLIYRIIGWILSFCGESMADEFKREFPDKCMLCSYYRYGLSHGFTTDPPPAHSCIESLNTTKEGE